MECRAGVFLILIPLGSRGARAVALAGVTNERGRDPCLPHSWHGSPCRWVAAWVLVAAAPHWSPAAGPPLAGHINCPIVWVSARPQLIRHRDNGAFFLPALGEDELRSLPK